MKQRLDRKFAKHDDGHCHLPEVDFIRKSLLESFPTNFGGGGHNNTKQKILKFMCQNSTSNVLIFPVYVLCYIYGGDNINKASIEKVFSCGDDGIFPSFNPCMLTLKDGHFYGVWNYNRLFNKVDCLNISQKKQKKGILDRYKKLFCLRCMVSYSSEHLHVCQGRCSNCLETMENHLNDDNNSFCEGEELHYSMCEWYFTNKFCYQAHRIEKFNGECGDYCRFLQTLKNCEMCLEDFKLTLCCTHFNKRPS